MDSLRRIRSGRFTLEQAATIDELQLGTAAAAVWSITEALSDWPRVKLTPEQTERITHGNGIRHAVEQPGPYLLIDESDNAVAIAEARGTEVLTPVKVLST